MKWKDLTLRNNREIYINLLIDINIYLDLHGRFDLSSRFVAVDAAPNPCRSDRWRRRLRSAVPHGRQ